MKDRPAMSMGARTGLTWAFAFMTGVLTNGCGSEENVSVGSVNRVLDLGVCSGEGTACDAPPASADAAEPLAPSEGAASQAPKLCDAEVSGMLAVDFQVDIVDLICSGIAGCNYNVADFKVAADGSVWLLAYLFEPIHRTPPRAWLGHIAANGLVLGQQVWPLTDYFELAWSIALREDEAVLLANDGSQSWTQHYDAAVNLTGSALRFESMIGYRIAGTPEGGLVLSGVLSKPAPGELARSLVAMVDQSGDVVWSQNNVAGVDNTHAIEVDGSGRTALITLVKALNTPSDFGFYVTHVTGFEANGNQAWSDAFDWMGDGFSGHELAFDDQGNLTIALVKDAARAWVQRFAPNGDPSWAWSLESNLNLGMTVIPSDGRVFVVTLEGDTKLDGNGSITELSADGQTCRKHAYTGVSMIDRLAASRSGQIYFVGHRSVGRFKSI